MIGANRKKYRFIFYILTIFIFICLISSLHFTFNMDEEFTMSIVKYNCAKLIGVDSLDVHPPLYYLSLKLFLQLVTWWTSSIFVKTICSRIFSLLTTLVGLYGLFKITKKLNIKVNVKLVALLYLFVPSILPYSTTIRMYSLSSLFIIFEFYFIIQFNKNNRLRDLILFTVFASLAAYTHYYAAVSAGSFILILFIFNIIKHKWQKSYQYFLSGILFIIMYIPIVPFVFKQFQYESDVVHLVNISSFIHEIYASLVGVTSSDGVPRMLFVSLLFIFMIILILWGFKNFDKQFNKYFIIIISDFIFTLFISFISFIVSKTPFMPRYMYADFSLYSFFITVIFSTYIFHYRNKNLFKLMMILSLLFICNSCKTLVKNVYDYDVPSVSLLTNFHSWKDSHSKLININKYNKVKKPFGDPLYDFQSAIYLKSIGKKSLIEIHNKKDENNVKFSLLGGHYNEKLYKYASDNNIKFVKIK